MKELWFGRVEVLTPPCDSGNTRAFMNVIARADDVLDFREFVSSVCGEYDWSLIGIEECGPAYSFSSTFSEQLLEELERAKDYPKACIFSTLHYYPSKPV